MKEATGITEVDILKDVIASDRGDFLPEVARSVLAWRFTDRAVDRINALAERNNKGTISDAERGELEKYLRVGSFVNLVQAKARLSLEKARP